MKIALLGLMYLTPSLLVFMCNLNFTLIHTFCQMMAGVSPFSLRLCLRLRLGWVLLKCKSMVSEYTVTVHLHLGCNQKYKQKHK